MSSITWQPIGRLEDIPVRGSRRLISKNKKIALFRTATDTVFAIDDQCPHKAGPLSEGIVHDNCVTCPLHNWVISLETGEAQGADSGKTTTYPIVNDEGELSIGFSDVKP